MYNKNDVNDNHGNTKDASEKKKPHTQYAITIRSQVSSKYELWK